VKPGGVDPLLPPLVIVPASLLIGVIWPVYTTWGVNQWSVFPASVIAGIFAAYVVIMTPFVSIRIRAVLDFICRPAERWLVRLPAPVRYAVLSAPVLTLFFLLGSRALVYGDGYSVVANSAAPLTPLPSGIHEISKFLPVMLHRLGYLIFSHGIGLPPESTFRLTSAVGGLIGFWGVVKLASLLAENRFRQAVIVLGTLSSACTVLFFGYAELYTLGTSVMLWLFVYVVGFIKGRNGAWPVILFSVILLASNLVLAPIAVLSLFVIARRTNHGCEGPLTYPLGVRPLSMNIVLVLGAGFLFWLLRKIEPSFFSVTLLPFEGNQYWFLSKAHLLDVANLLLLLAPISVALLLSPLFFRSAFFRPKTADPTRSVLISFAVTALLLTFWIDPIMGAPRDWDLVSVAGFPVSLLVAYLVAEGGNSGSKQKGYAVRMAALSLLLVLPNVYEKSHAEVATTRLDGLLWRDPHYQTDFDKAYRCISWGALLNDRLNRPDMAIRFLKRRLEIDSLCDVCLYDVGQAYMNRKEYDSAAIYLGVAASLYPVKAKAVASYAYDLQLLGDTAQASRVVARLQSMGDLDGEAEELTAITCARLGHLDQALPHFRRCLALESDRWEPKANLAAAFSKLGAADSAEFYIVQALSSAPSDARKSLYPPLVQTQIALGKYGDARTSLERYLTEFPNAPDARQLQELVQSKNR